ncbi:MAG: PH domain-containing protein [Oscillospiraceae bacterium]|nr:PH domain-containing protein [Oscillospiraceae bacterium]
MKRQHKIAILNYMKGNFWLLFLPVIRGIFSVKFNFSIWIKGAYLDIIVILFVIGLAYFRWHFVRFEIQKKEIHIRKGLLFLNEFALPYSAISCAACCRPLLFRPLKAVKISLDSDSHPISKRKNKADVTLYVSETDYLQLYNKIPTDLSCMKISYQASKKDLIIFSLLFSSTLSGIIFIGTFFIRGSKVVGERLEEEFFSAVSSVTKAVKFFAEEATTFSVSLTIIIAAGWLVSFLTNLFRHIRFGIHRRGSNIIVENGYFSHWKYYVNSSRINYADLQQNLLMKIAKIMSVHVSCTGYGKRKNEIPVFVPVTTRRRVMSTLEMMLPDFTQSNISAKPKRTYIAAYIWLPLVLTVGIPVAMTVLTGIFAEWSGAIKFVGAMLEIPSVYLLAVKIAAKMTTGIGVGRDTLTVKYCRAYKFHTIIVPKGRVAYIKIRRTPFQRVSDCCDVIIYTRGERAAKHRVRGVLVAEAEKIAQYYDKIGKNA